MAEKDPLKIIGQKVADKYVIERMVGEGGFAVVYRAMHTIWKSPVAIKFFSELSSVPSDQRDEMVEAFNNEGNLLQQLSTQTAAIVQARDVGEYTTPEGRWMPYMVLEWLEGRSLEEILDIEHAAGRPQFTLAETIRLLGPVAAALDVAHGKGICHRDVKPPNIFVLGDDPRAPNITVKILDFGVAKMITDNTQMKAALAKTGTNITSFTPQYGAPEQFSRSYGATGPWTDVFALALVAIEMITGRHALDGEDLIQLAYSAGNGEKRPTPRALGADIPDSVEHVFAKAISVQPAARYSRCGEFWAALEAAASRDSSGIALSATMAMPSEILPGMFPNRTEHSPMETTGPRSVTTASPATLGALPAPEKKSPLPVIVGVAIGVIALGGGGIVLVKSAGGGKPEIPAATGAPSSSPVAPVASGSAAPSEASCPEGMTKIPAGEFYMGSDSKDAEAREKPAHNVSVDSFCVDTYEVTAADYKKCSDSGGCLRPNRAERPISWPNITPKQKAAYEPLCNGDVPGREKHPMNCISWKEAETYCRKTGKRLPTEAEWEFATRGPDGRIYPWGDDAPTPEHLNACDSECESWAKKEGVDVLVLFSGKSDGFSGTAPVGSFPKGKSRFGPYDVVGNVFEWVADWEGPYGPEEQKNPTGPTSGKTKIIRGGAWNGARESWLRPSFRYGNDPEVRSPGVGVRCAKSLK